MIDDFGTKIDLLFIFRRCLIIEVESSCDSNQLFKSSSLHF